VFSFFAIAAGVAATRFLHDHRMVDFLAANALWFGSLGAIHLRARRAGGNFLGTDARLYYGFGLVGFFLAVLFVCGCYLFYG